MKVIPVIFLALFIFAVTGDGTHAAKKIQRTREFSEYKCKLTLPSRGCKWLDEKRFPDAIAAFVDEGGTKVVLSVGTDGEKAPKNLPAASEYMGGFFKSSKMKETSAMLMTFRGVRCYEFHAWAHADKSIWTGRLFEANGYLYQLQVIGSPLPVKDREKLLEPLFESFEFIGTPVLPEEKSELFKQGQKLGKYLVYVVIGVIGLALFKMIRGKAS